MFSNQLGSEGSTTTAQFDFEPEDVLSLDNVTISTDLFSTCLEIGYTWYGAILEPSDFESRVALLLSLDNESWIEVKQYTFDDNAQYDNVSMEFTICNTILQAFPFDVEKGESLFVCIEYVYDSPSYLSHITWRTSSFAIVVPIAITRPWYFTMDWRFPGLLGASFLFLFTVFLISRRDKIKVE
jgi:hypothetical protein